MPFDQRLRSLSAASVAVTDPFWSERQRRLLTHTLPEQARQMEATGRIANFRRAIGEEDGGHEGYRFNDSDLYKWLEAAGFALQSRPNDPEVPALREQVRAYVDLIARTQMPDGYLNTWIQLTGIEMKWRGLAMFHEMYCAGHLIEAAVALDEAGEPGLLAVGRKFADHIAATFGPGKRKGYCGHQELETALVRLAGHTGEERYRELARWMIETRGSRPSPFEEEFNDPAVMEMSKHGMALLDNYGRGYDGEYLQDHAPIRDHTSVVGHAVRAMYMYMAAAELCEDAPLADALESLYAGLTERRMYVTGGIGPSGDNEGFTFDYDLPNLSAYAETCAAIGLVFWSKRMLDRTADAGYGDTLERALYNGVLSGISLDGTQYFYDNPLESRGRHKRVPYFPCSCCPPNVARLIGSVARYAFSQDDSRFFVHLPIGMETETVMGGVRVRLAIESNYPWSGTFKIRVEPERTARFALHVRLPDWADDVQPEVPGSEEEAGFERGYAVFDREWKSGDTVAIEFEMPARWVSCHPSVLDNLGRLSLARGPLVYCLESLDTDGVPPQQFVADPDAEVVEEDHPLGVTALRVAGVFDDPAPRPLYEQAEEPALVSGEGRFIPYYAWANRGPSFMQVWVRA